MPKFRRPQHRLIAQLLQSLNSHFLADCKCFFGGGTQLALSFGEYRESRDIDFLCSDRGGFRRMRETVNSHSLGQILQKPVALAREVRADRDGIRTFFAANEIRIKFEIVLEARIDLAGSMDKRLGVPTLDLEHAVAEKLLANADRGLDDSTHARDIIDLAFIGAHHDAQALLPGFHLARTAYGTAVIKQLKLTLEHLRAEKRRLTNHAAALGIENLPELRRGLKILSALADKQ